MLFDFEFVHPAVLTSAPERVMFSLKTRATKNASKANEGKRVAVVEL